MSRLDHSKTLQPQWFIVW